MADNDADEVIVRSTTELAQRLGLQVVAEGVDAEDTWQQLVEIGCEEAQGFYLARPLPAGDFTAWLIDRTRAGRGHGYRLSVSFPFSASLALSVRDARQRLDGNRAPIAAQPLCRGALQLDRDGRLAEQSLALDRADAAIRQVKPLGGLLRYPQLRADGARARRGEREAQAHALLRDRGDALGLRHRQTRLTGRRGNGLPFGGAVPSVVKLL